MGYGNINYEITLFQYVGITDLILLIYSYLFYSFTKPNQMKTFCLTTLIAVFLFFCTNGIQAQTIQPKLNQAELLKQFAGDWEISVGNDTNLFISVKHFSTGNGFYVSDKLITQGKRLVEGTGFWAYDDAINKITLSLLRSDGEVIQNQGIFTSTHTYEYSNVNNSPSYLGVTKCSFEFTSPNEIKGIFIFNNQEFIQTMKRVLY